MQLNATTATPGADETVALKATVIDNQLNSVRVQVSEVEGLIGALSDALSQVLTPDSPIAKLAAAGGDAKAPAQSVLANELGVVAGRLRVQADTLRELLSRIEA